VLYMIAFGREGSPRAGPRRTGADDAGAATEKV